MFEVRFENGVDGCVLMVWHKGVFVSSARMDSAEQINELLKRMRQFEEGTAGWVGCGQWEERCGFQE